MATANYAEFKSFKILIGDGADPEVFTPKCTISRERGFSLNPSFNDIELPDCADDNLPNSIFKALTSLSAAVTGNGVLDKGDLTFFDQWLLNNETKNVRVLVGDVGDGRQYDFPGKLTNFEMSASRSEVVQADITIESNGTITPSDYT